jgi:hypothetical protein
MTFGIGFFEQHPFLLKVLFDIVLFPSDAAPPPGCESSPNYRSDAVQLLANLLENSDLICVQFSDRDRIAHFLSLVQADDYRLTVLMLRVFTSFIGSRPETSGVLDWAVFDSFRPRFEHQFTLCATDDFRFLKR